MSTLLNDYRNCPKCCHAQAGARGSCVPAWWWETLISASPVLSQPPGMEKHQQNHTKQHFLHSQILYD